MSTEIQWTDETWNPVTGCDKVSPGCAHCYAEGVADRFWGKQYPRVEMMTAEAVAAGESHTRPREFTDVMTHSDRLDQPLRWKKPRKVFVNSMSDLFHEDVPDAFIDQVFAVMAMAPQHTFQVLTKRAARMRGYLTGATLESRGPLDPMSVRFADIAIAAMRLGATVMPLLPLPNVWLGVSVENQHFADERIPLLLQTPAAVRFLSCEPLLEGLDISKHRPGANRLWVIVGGESGPHARPLWVPWVRSIVRQCQEADAPVFVKQLGADVRDRNDAGFTGDGSERSWPDMDPDDIEEDLDGSRDGYQGAPVRVHLRSKKGGDMAEWPEDLRVREFPA